MPLSSLHEKRRGAGVTCVFAGSMAVLLAAIGCGQRLEADSSLPQFLPVDSRADGSMDVPEKSDQPVIASRGPAPRGPSVQDDPVPQDPFPRKVALPPNALEGGIEWLNASGPITLPALRGKIVLLDFWTYCCINCMHVLPDLKRLEEKYSNQLVVIGIHSAKFETERESQNIREAILRYEIKHPVVNDAEMIIWRHFDVHAWPTLMMIDPEGNLVGYLSGERVYEALDQAIGMLAKFHRAKGTLNEHPVRFDLESARATDTPLRFPGKVLADSKSDRLFIADSNHNRIVITTLAGKLVDVVGSGEIGREDGAFDRASFYRPQGLALLDGQLYVADTENHSIRRVDLRARTVATVSGVGTQGVSRSFTRQPAGTTALNSPWDLCIHEGKIYVAMAGPHQIWLYDPAKNEIAAYAGSGLEDIEDGDPPTAAFAQPSGIATDGDWLFVADSEGSSVRAVPLMPEKAVWTVVGTAHLEAGRLFDFGDVDGENGRARLQHPLGVAWHDGVLYVADTYNNKVKVVDPDKRTVMTFLGDTDPGNADDPPQFDEPAGLSGAGGRLFVADTNNHVIRVIDIDTKRVTTLKIDGLKPPRVTAPHVSDFADAERVMFESQRLPIGADVELRVSIELPDGVKLNDLAPISYQIDNVGTGESVRGDRLGVRQQLSPATAQFSLPVRTADAAGTGAIRLSLTYYFCREDAGGICEVRSVIYEIPLELAAKGTKSHVDLPIRPR